MSGWWLSSSAIAATRFTNASAPAKSSNSKSRSSASGRCDHTPVMRIVSLVPSATEMLFALGVGDEVAPVTHECDHPPEALELPKITRDVIGPGLPPGEMDRVVRELTLEGRSLYELDEPMLR